VDGKIAVSPPSQAAANEIDDTDDCGGATSFHRHDDDSPFNCWAEAISSLVALAQAAANSGIFGHC
jgi:hypothetical protein